jgi:hypothetical protein
MVQDRRSVKPSAQPTLVRTQHLPPPAKTARGLGFLRPRGPWCVVHLVSSVVRRRRCTTMVTDTWRTESGREERFTEPLDPLPSRSSSGPGGGYSAVAVRQRPEVRPMQILQGLPGVMASHPDGNRQGSSRTLRRPANGGFTRRRLAPRRRSRRRSARPDLVETSCVRLEPGSCGCLREYAQKLTAGRPTRPAQVATSGW